MRQVPTRLAGRLETADRWLDVWNPYDGSLVARVPALRPEHIDEACAAATAAFARDDFPRHERAAVLDRTATLLGERVDEFAWTVVHEAGTPLRYAGDEVHLAVDILRMAAAEARRPSGDVPPADVPEATADRLGFDVRLPVGVVGATVATAPPLALAAHRLGPAVAAGCPVVLKPSAATPLSAVHLVDLLVEAGLPLDWVSVLTGDTSLAAALAAAPVPRMYISGDAGPPAPVVVEPDADLDVVANLLRSHAFSPLTPTLRVLVHESRHDDLACTLRRTAKELVAGDPAGADTEVGPTPTAEARDRLLATLRRLRDAGADVTGGVPHGSVISPAVVAGAPDAVGAVVVENGAPVVTVTPYPGFDAAVDIANRDASGGYASVFTASLPTAVRALRTLRFRGVLLNELPPLGTYRVDRAVRDLTELRFLSLSA